MIARSSRDSKTGRSARRFHSSVYQQSSATSSTSHASTSAPSRSTSTAPTRELRTRSRTRTLRSSDAASRLPPSSLSTVRSSTRLLAYCLSSIWASTTVFWDFATSPKSSLRTSSKTSVLSRSQSAATASSNRTSSASHGAGSWIPLHRPARSSQTATSSRT